MHKKYLQIFLILFIGSLLIAPMVFAQGDINEKVYDIGIGFAPDEYSTDEGISKLINDIYRNALIIGGIAAVAVIIYGAIYLTISGASPDKQKEGKDIITSAIWGVILLFGAFILLNTINPQLIEIDPPGGRMSTSTPEPMEQGEIDSCIDKVSDTEYNKCQQRVVVIEGEPRKATCSEGEPICKGVSVGGGQYGGATMEYYPACAESAQVLSEVDVTCKPEGTPTCEKTRLVCSSSDNVSSKPINWVGDCGIGWLTGGCKKEVKKKTEIIEPGGAYAQALYYPSNGDPSQAQCLVYDYQISPADPIERAGLSGLKLCIGSKEENNQ